MPGEQLKAKEPTNEELGMPVALWNAQALEMGVNIADIVALERQRRMRLLPKIVGQNTGQESEGVIQ
jgi:hypothetical protein